MSGLLATVYKPDKYGCLVRITYKRIETEGSRDDKHHFDNSNLILRGHADWRDRREGRI